MRFIVMHKVDSVMESGQLPDEELIKKMRGLVQRSLESGVFQNGAGLHRSATRARVEVSGGRTKVTKGAIAGKNELPAGLVMIHARSLDHAIELAARFAAIWGDGEIEVGPVVQPKDLAAVPEAPQNREGPYLLIQKSTPESERGAKLPPEKRRALEGLQDELRNAGVLLAAEELAPSARGSRLPAAAPGKRRWVDGPFTESKELIAGFSILELPSKEEALAWADEYAAILHGNEVDLREIG
jgi:hypothetical protein